MIQLNTNLSREFLTPLRKNPKQNISKPHVYVYTHMLCYAKSLQSCSSLCDPIDGSPPGSPIPGILQARTLEWVAISFSSAWKWKVKVKSLSHAGLLATPWTAAYQAPPSVGFSKQEYWSGVPLPSPIHTHIQAQIGEGDGNPLQYSCLENPTDKGAWRATIHGVAKSWTPTNTQTQIQIKSPPFLYVND